MTLFRIRACVLVIAVLGGGAVLAQQPASSVSVTPSTTGFAEREPRYRLHMEDRLEIKFRMTPDWDQGVSVQPDGFISLLDVGDIHVLGLTLEEVREEILERYSTFLRDPILTVKLVNFAKPYFVVGGEVKTPGRFDFLGQPTASEAIAVAGGFTVGARSTDVYIARRVSKDRVEMKRVNVKMAQNGQPEEDVQLAPGDAIFVPRSTTGKIDRFLSVSRLYYLFRIPVY
jgi:polysaccharide biosynthesis/export protein